MTLSRRHALLLAAALPAACASPNPALYTLAPVSGAIHAGAPRLVELRAVAMPHYLERSEIVRSTEDYRLDVLPNDWWGESLASMFSRVLAQDLSQRLPNSTVYSDSGAISAAPDATVAVNVQRFDVGRTGALLLRADVVVTRATPLSRRARITVPVPGSTTAGLVRAMSAAVGQLADAVAAVLASLPPAAPPR